MQESGLRVQDFEGVNRGLGDRGDRAEGLGFRV